MLKGIAILVALTVAVKCSSTETATAGFMLSLSADYFQEYKTQIMDTFRQLVLSIDLHDTCPTFDTGFVNVKMCTLNRRIKSISFKEDQTKLDISEKDHIRIIIFGNEATFDMDFNIYSDPEWIRDQGSGSITFQEFDIGVSLIPTRVNGKLQFKFKDPIFNVGYMDG